MSDRLSRHRLGLGAASALLIGGVLGLATPASASTDPIVNHLISSTTAKGLGFPTVYQKPVSSHATKSKTCTDAAEVAFVNNKTSVGLVDEIFQCQSSSAAKSFLAGSKIKPDTSMTPPKSLGQGAVGSSANAPLYAYYWTRGSYVAFVGVDTDATSSSQAPQHKPLTEALGGTLKSAAVHQDALIR
jgi:hypothetical protein